MFRNNCVSAIYTNFLFAYKIYIRDFLYNIYTSAFNHSSFPVYLTITFK